MHAALNPFQEGTDEELRWLLGHQSYHCSKSAPTRVNTLLSGDKAATERLGSPHNLHSRCSLPTPPQLQPPKAPNIYCQGWSLTLLSTGVNLDHHL